MEGEAYEQLISRTSPQNDLVQKGLIQFKDTLKCSKVNFNKMPVYRTPKVKMNKNSQNLNGMIKDKLK